MVVVITLPIDDLPCSLRALQVFDQLVIIKTLLGGSL